MFNYIIMYEIILKQNDIIEIWLYTEQYYRDIDVQNGIIWVLFNIYLNSIIDMLLYKELYYKVDFKLCKMVILYICIERL